MNKNTYYLKIEGTKEEIENMVKIVSSINSNFNNSISIGQLYDCPIEILTETWTDSFSEYNSLRPLFSKVSKDEIENEIYRNILNNRHDIFDHLIKLREEKVGI